MTAGYNYSIGNVFTGNLTSNFCGGNARSLLVHGNHLSSTMMVTDITGSVSQAVIYAPFGQIISSYNPMSWQNGIVPEYMFTAAERDEESGLDYMHARYYNSGSGTFNSRDLLFEKYPWMSPYSYSFNNPVRYIDPTGMSVEDPGDGGENPPKGTSQQEASQTPSGGTAPTSTGNSVSNTVKKVASTVGAALGTVWEGFKKLDAALEGGADGGNQGTITKQDVIVGTSIAGVFAGGIGILEAVTAGSTTGIVMGSLSTANAVDDAFTNSTGESGLQQMTTNPTAKTAIGAGKVATSAVSGGYGIYNWKNTVTSPTSIGSTLLDLFSGTNTTIQIVKQVK